MARRSTSRCTSARSPSSTTCRASTSSISRRRSSRGSSTGKITTWNAPEIVADNPDATLTDLPITPVNRSDESGTTENFTEYLVATAGEAWPYEASGDWPVSGGQSAQGTSGVVQTVQGGEGTIGYADASKAGSLGTAKIKVGEQWVGYSPEAAAAVVDASPRAEGRSEHDIVVELDRTTTADGAYPLVLISYSLACTSYEDPADAELVKAFLGYVASAEGQEAAASAAGAAPISDDAARGRPGRARLHRRGSLIPARSGHRAGPPPTRGGPAPPVGQGSPARTDPDPVPLSPRTRHRTEHM